MSGQDADTGVESQPTTQAAGAAQPAGAARQSYGDLLTSPLTKRFAKFSAGVNGGVAVGLGVTFVLLKYLGKPAVTSSSSGTGGQEGAAAMAATEFANTSAQFAIYVLPVLAAAVAAYVGLYAARELDVGDRELFVAAGAGAAVGAFLLVVAGAFLVSMGFGTASVEGQQVVGKPGTVDLANVAFNGVAVAVGAAVLSVATAWTDRTLA
ncbi:hypothetical protein [Halobacterium yunchengense]|uniref:hypothetical protein n=1 Tax=Halobacterium yunchengense TaxID=3108497 RepID=UPI00300B6FA0